MKSISKLKDEARRHEQREEWDKAIQAYLQVLKIASEAETEVELPLYNRLGDLCVRMGKPQDAVRYYEQAADRYAEAGLYNNAIALCNKALRYNPERAELIRKLGQFSASQGFITDARRYFLDYAERQFKGGKVTEALNALEDFANVSDDADIREMLGRQLAVHGRVNDAIDELKKAHAMRVRDGDTELADRIRAEILAIDPQATFGEEVAPPAPAPASHALVDLPGFIDFEMPGPTAVTPPADVSTEPVAGLDTGALPGDSIDDIQLTGFEATGASALDIDLPGSADIEGLETSSLDFGTVEDSAPALSDLSIEHGEGLLIDGGGRDAETFALPDPEPPGVIELPEYQEVGSAFDLPLLDDPTVEATPLAAAEIDMEEVDVPVEPLSESTSVEDVVDEPTTWDTSEPAFDLPTLDSDVLGSTWEPETPTFELPTLDEPEAETPDVPAPVETSETVIEPAAEAINSAFVDQANAEAIEIPAIELPTWDTDPLVEPVVEAVEVDETVWVEDTSDSDDEAAIPLPTFSYETEDADADDAEDTGVLHVVPEEDPLGLADHLRDHSLEGDGQEAEPLVEVEPEVLAAEPVFVEPEPEPEAEPAAIEPAPVAFEQEPVAFEAEPVAFEAEPVAFEPEPVELEPVETEPVAFEPEPVSAEPEPEPTVFEPEPVAFEPEPVAFEPEAEPVAFEVEPAAFEPDPSVARSKADWLDEIEDEPEPAADEWDVVAVDGTVGSAAEPGDVPVEDVAELVAQADEAVVEATAAGPVPGAAPTGDFVDLGALVTGDNPELTTRFRVRETAPTGDEDRDFAELLSQFKLKVQEHLPPEDASAHYDLGLAFKEMGLLDEAISEFQIALRAGHMRMKVYEELGQCFLQKEQYNIAEKVLSRALDLEFDDELDLLGVYYHLGRAYEALGRPDQARDAYERVLGMDINFEDVTDRLARL